MIYKRSSLLSIILLLCASGGAGGATVLTAQAAPDAEEYSVYSALLEKEFARGGPPLVILADYPSWDAYARGGAQYLRTLMPSVPEEVRDDFEAKNRRPYRLRDQLRAGVPYVLVSLEECRELLRRQKRKEYKARCPSLSWSMTLSRVGFSAGRDRAVVYVGIRCRGLCGSGEYFLLTKESGAWEIRERRRVWVS